MKDAKKRLLKVFACFAGNFRKDSAMYELSRLREGIQEFCEVGEDVAIMGIDKAN